LYTALVSAAARGAGQVITDSEASRNDIREHLGIADEGVTAIYLGVGPAYKPESNFLLDMAVRKKYELPDEYILYLGGYEIHKNVTTLLLAYTYVLQGLGEDYPLVLAGRKPEKASVHFPDYEGYIEQLGIKEQVRWIGFVEEGDKPVVYRGASAFVFPSKYEGFGLPVLEAMACGTPVVSSDAASLPEVIGDAGYGIDPEDARQFAGSIIATVTEPGLAAELKRRGLAQAATFTWEKTATETLLVYDALLGGRGLGD
jgi:glycosyltransferase involved in cell wall biosynthesis